MCRMCLEYLIVIIDIYVFINCIYFFFFQAEDGIRDGRVTGVQTCALPICHGEYSRENFSAFTMATDSGCPPARKTANISRSEERRVGKECRSRWTRDH